MIKKLTVYKIVYMYIDLIKLKPNKKEIFSFPVALWDFLWSVGKSFLPKVQESHNSFWVGGFWHESIELLETTILFVYKIVYMYIIKLKPNKKEIFSFPVASWDFLWSVGKKNYQKSKSPIILFGSGGFDMSRLSYWKRQYFCLTGLNDWTWLEYFHFQ